LQPVTSARLITAIAASEIGTAGPMSVNVMNPDGESTGISPAWSAMA